MQSADNRSAAFGIRHRAGKGLGQSQKCKQSVPTSRRNALFPFVPFFLAFTGRPGSWGWQSPLCSSFTTSREISQSTACLVGGEGPSSPTPRSCAAPIPKGHAGGIGPLHTDRELEHDSVVGCEGIKGPLLDLDADVRDARVGCGAELAVCDGGNAQPVAGCKLDILTVDRD